MGRVPEDGPEPALGRSVPAGDDQGHRASVAPSWPHARDSRHRRTARPFRHRAEPAADRAVPTRA